MLAAVKVRMQAKFALQKQHAEGVLSSACKRSAVNVVLTIVQEDASLFEDLELLHVYKGTYTAEYDIEHSQHGWRIVSSTITL